jgi:pyroglutamyl-peptidase
VVLPVEYDTVRDRLCEAARGFDPDIAIHFGLAAGASGFRLEHVARNEHRARPDNAGRLPATGPICAAPETMPSTIPLDAIAAALSAEGLPVEWSDDAGGYLCNMVFMLSQAHACDGLFPTMGGFVHVPHLARREDARGLSRAELARGALIIIDATVRAWRAERTSSPLS